MVKSAESVLVCLSCTNGNMGVSQRPKDLTCDIGNKISTSIYKDAYIIQGKSCTDYVAKQSQYIVDYK